MNHVDKYYWIIDHPELGDKSSQSSIELTPHKVNPLNETIEDDISLNTEYRWWVEVTSPEFDGNDWEYIHHWNLDTGGKTAEEAIDKVYDLVLKHYGNYDEI